MLALALASQSARAQSLGDLAKQCRFEAFRQLGFGNQRSDLIVRLTSDCMVRRRSGAAAPVAFSGPSFNAASGSKTVIAGRALKLGYWLSLNPDCSSLGRTEVRVASGPERGRLAVKYAADFPTYPATNARSVCNRQRRPATQLWYTAPAGFAGVDHVSAYIVFPSGATRTLSFTVSVIP
jgi:hypothetical protein